MTPDVNLGKLVPLKVHGRLKKAKLAKKYFPILESGVPYIAGKLKTRAFQQIKEHASWIHFGEIRPQKSSDYKSGVFRECSRATPHVPRGGPVEGCRSICMEGGVSHSGLTIVNLLKPLT